MLRVASALVLVVAVSGCAGNTASTPDPSAPAPAGGTSLTVSVADDEGATPQVSVLECDPPGGDHLEPARACEVLAAASGDPFAPVPADAVCGQVYGGPQQAQVTGTWRGAPVDASFTLKDSCEISRWKDLVPVLPAPPE